MPPCPEATNLQNSFQVQANLAAEKLKTKIARQGSLTLLKSDTVDIRVVGTGLVQG